LLAQLITARAHLKWHGARAQMIPIGTDLASAFLSMAARTSSRRCADGDCQERPMLKFGSLVLTMLVAVAPAAIAQGVGTPASPAPDPATAQKGRVLTQQGRVSDESAVAKSKLVAPKRTQPGGSVPPNGTPGPAPVEGALTFGRDKLKSTTRTTKPLATGQAAPNLDAYTPKVGQPASR
jgi:hypothetical protein